MQTRVTSAECQRRRGTCHDHMTPQEEIRKDCTELAVALLVRRDAGARGRGEAVDRGADGESRAALWELLPVRAAVAVHCAEPVPAESARASHGGRVYVMA